MKPYYETRLRIVGPLVLYAFGTIFFRLNVYFSEDLNMILRYEWIGISAGYICWNLTRWVVLLIQRRNPGLGQTKKRLLWLAAVYPFLVNIGVFIRLVAHSWLSGKLFYWPGLFDYATTTGIQLFYHSIYIAIYEGIYLYRQWQQTNAEKEALLKVQWQGQFESLKNQVNPHFLFNSLNSLSSLISDEPAKAERFVDEMAKVYRYLLRSNEGELTTLKTELGFISSYTHLLKTRYGKGISVTVDVEAVEDTCYLPPLTLQMLVENAVKHNTILNHKPLTIEIKAMPSVHQHVGQLMVRNNLQKRTIRTGSNQVGLSNIAAKYQMLSKQDIVVEDDGQYFTVLLPLLSETQLIKAV
ncbi:sensor histidine kinase [Spirosoma soli]|uniref:Sensor histidine kinase n=1 Tax=Spirosoma soli TaxID=1770529 RepID=A0ABW5M6H5_9BACT